MSKKKTTSRRLPQAFTWMKRRKYLALAAVILMITGTGAALAPWRTRVPQTKLHALFVPPPPPPISPPSSPAKEYIYVGSRLVTTEEPMGPTNLRYVETSNFQFTTNGYLNWNDNTENETGFIVESQDTVSAPGIWTTFGQVGPNVTTHNISVDGPGYDFRIKAIFTTGFTYSNVIHVQGPGCFCITPPPKCIQVCYANSTCSSPPTSLIINEFRFRGASGAKDEFVEFYNNSNSPITVCTADGSGGWTLAAMNAAGSSASPVFTIPNDTVIPARGHYLAVNSSPTGGYSLSSYPNGGIGDFTYTADIADNSGIALFKTANPANFNTSNRLDAAGFSGPSGAVADLYREPDGLTPIGSFFNDNITFVRRIAFVSGGIPSDTNNNSADFLFLSTTGGIYAGVQSKLGAPGPENLNSPIQRTDAMPAAFIDATVAAANPPNRVRDLTPNPANNSSQGTLSIRRRVINNTGVTVTRVRFRIILITTFPVPAGTADMRALTSTPVTVSNVNDANTCAATGTPSTPPCTVTIQGTTVETPPAQPNGGGFNTTLSVTLPQPLAPGASVNLQWLLGLQQTGSFQFFVITEVLP